MKVVQQIAPEEFQGDGGERIRFDRWTVTAPGEVLAETSPLIGVSSESVLSRYCSEMLIGAADSRLRCVLPFADLRDRTNGGMGFSEVFTQNLPILTQRRSALDWRQEGSALAASLVRYVYLRTSLTPAQDDVQAHLCGLSAGGTWTATVALGMWSGAKASMDSGDVRIERRYDDGVELSLLAAELISRFGMVTLRDAMRQSEQRANGVLSPFHAGYYQFSLGVCSVIFCVASNVFVITRRGRRTHVNRGRVCAASGGVNWAAISKHHELFAALDASIMDEHHEEIGDVNGFRFIRVGFARELAREGSPEFFYTVCFPGTVEQVVQIIASNTHPDSDEVDGYVYAFSPEAARALLMSENGCNVVHNKGLMNLYFSLIQMGEW